MPSTRRSGCTAPTACCGTSCWPDEPARTRSSDGEVAARVGGHAARRAAARPGHSPGCCCFARRLAASSVFSGDTLFCGEAASPPARNHQRRAGRSRRRSEPAPDAESSPQDDPRHTTRKESSSDRTPSDAMTVHVGGRLQFPPPYAAAGAADHAASSSTTRGATTTFIPDLLGVEPDGRPWAELWLGTHPSGPATLTDGRPLDEVTGTLPYLLKVLAAAEPLSLQAHPRPTQARGRVRRRPLPGPRAEAGAAVRADPVRGVLRRPAGRRDIEPARRARRGANWPTSCATARPAATRASAVHGAVCPASRSSPPPQRAHRPEAIWVPAWPSATPAIRAWPSRCCSTTSGCAPGEAIQLGPGNLHAYLGGAGIELMGASDNVVRGGLTTSRSTSTTCSPSSTRRHSPTR